ncbi:hypothetical protein ACOME3_003790 [Neoechinorhynchus agilis]
MKDLRDDNRRRAKLSQLVSQPENATCFDCLQKGISYANMTVGTFVCIRCSGVLRGLIPPHRLKSISICTFSNDEIQFLFDRGNMFMKAVYGDLKVPPETRNAKVMKRFLSGKYGRKPDFEIKVVKGTQNELKNDFETLPLRVTGNSVKLCKISDIAARLTGETSKDSNNHAALELCTGAANSPGLNSKKSNNESVDNFANSEVNSKVDDLVTETLEFLKSVPSAPTVMKQSRDESSTASLVAQDIEKLLAEF